MSFWSNKRVVVTGGAGFLGQYVIERLKKKKCKSIFVPHIEQYNLTNLTQCADVTGYPAKRFARSLFTVPIALDLSQKPPVQFLHATALSLPAYPLPGNGVPFSIPVKEKKPASVVLLIERLYGRCGKIEELRFFPRHVLLSRIPEMSENSDWKIVVYIGKVRILHALKRPGCGVLARKQGGVNNQGSVLVRNAVGKLHLRQVMRLDKYAYPLADNYFCSVMDGKKE